MRAVDLLSDCEGAYGIGINPSPWVKSFICNEHNDLIDDETSERIEEDEFDFDEIDELDEHKTGESIEDKADRLIHGVYRGCRNRRTSRHYAMANARCRLR